MSGEGPEVYRRAQAHSMKEAAALVERALGRKVARTERDRVAGSHAVYFVTLADGFECVLRVATYPGHDLAREWWVMEQCRGRGVPVPETLAGETAPADGALPYLIARRMPGVPAHEAPLSDREREAVFAQLGEYAALIHGISVPGFGGLQRAGDAYTGGAASLGEAFVGNIEYYLVRLPAEALPPSRALAVRERVRSARGVLDRPQGALVHGDFRFGNILLDGLRVSAVLDLELAQSGDPAMDLASLRYCEGRDDADLSAILRGYGRRDLLAPEETLPARLLFYQMLYALDHLFWEHGFRNERGITEAQERLRRFEESLDHS